MPILAQTCIVYVTYEIQKTVELDWWIKGSTEIDGLIISFGYSFTIEQWSQREFRNGLHTIIRKFNLKKNSAPTLCGVRVIIKLWDLVQ